jgi:glycosyltransferase involved in cell wall biosynthesis
MGGSTITNGLLQMKIAQVAPLYESVPPRYYGGTERVVYHLTEELVRQGHEVTLFASGDSTTTGTLVPICPQALRLDDHCVDSMAHHILLLEQVSQAADRFDIIHFHVDYLHFPLSRLTKWPQVTTLHGRLDLPDLPPLYEEFSEMPVISISDAQRAPLPQAQWVDTVYHGLPPDLYAYRSTPGAYLAFLGRISPEKRVDRAIQIAERAGLPLKIAAKVDPADRPYFEKTIRPLLTASHVEFLGEISEDEKGAFLGNARALLFPIDWPEPFGLVLIEALACGTPVIASPHGSVPEILEDERTGFIVDSVDEAVAAVGRLASISRRDCRAAFEERFTADRMAREYVRAYETLRSPTHPHAHIPLTRDPSVPR